MERKIVTKQIFSNRLQILGFQQEETGSSESDSKQSLVLLFSQWLHKETGQSGWLCTKVVLWVMQLSEGLENRSNDHSFVTEALGSFSVLLYVGKQEICSYQKTHTCLYKTPLSSDKKEVQTWRHSAIELQDILWIEHLTLIMTKTKGILSVQIKQPKPSCQMPFSPP